MSGRPVTDKSEDEILEVVREEVGKDLVSALL
jgi:hypothetical protein